MYITLSRDQKIKFKLYFALLLSLLCLTLNIYFGVSYLDTVDKKMGEYKDYYYIKCRKDIDIDSPTYNSTIHLINCESEYSSPFNLTMNMI